MKTSINYKDIYYPPGGILLWIIIYLELITFGIALVAMIFYGKEESSLFHNSRLMLNSTYGMINTIFLLTSGFFMASAVNELKVGAIQKSKSYLLITMLFGFLFLVLKGIEYWDKVSEGLVMGYNTFFTFYWSLTLFHVTHVIVGLIILISVYFGLKKPKTTIEDAEASAAFWHMCDLIWLLLFPVIYLIF